jgi:hypothetical protein
MNCPGCGQVEGGVCSPICPERIKREDAFEAQHHRRFDGNVNAPANKRFDTALGYTFYDLR